MCPWKNSGKFDPALSTKSSKLSHLQYFPLLLPFFQLPLPPPHSPPSHHFLSESTRTTTTTPSHCQPLSTTPVTARMAPNLIKMLLSWAGLFALFAALAMANPVQRGDVALLESSPNHLRVDKGLVRTGNLSAAASGMLAFPFPFAFPTTPHMLVPRPSSELTGN